MVVVGMAVYGGGSVWLGHESCGGEGVRWPCFWEEVGLKRKKTPLFHLRRISPQNCEPPTSTNTRAHDKMHNVYALLAQNVALAGQERKYVVYDDLVYEEINLPGFALERPA